MLSKQAAGSPCIDVCAIDDTSGLCAGCYRTSEEIATWDRLSRFQRRLIMATAQERRDRLNPTGKALPTFARDRGGL